MGHRIHRLRDDAPGAVAGRPYRVWTTVTGGYCTPPMNDAELLQWLLEERLEHVLRERLHHPFRFVQDVDRWETPRSLALAEEERELRVAHPALYLGTEPPSR